MGEEEKRHFELYEEIISLKMKPIYWMMGLIVTIFVTIAAPLTIILISTVEKVSAKADTEKMKAEFDKADKTYLQKWDYYQIEEDEHRVMKEIIKNPQQADYLMGIINNNILEKCGFKYVSRGGETK